MKKYIICLIMGILLLCPGCSSNDINKISEDEKKFKEEYESLNGQKTSDGKKYIEVDIPEENHVVYEDEKGIIERLENGTGAIYFGFKECPWCRQAVPVLIKTAQSLGLNSIYYFDASKIRDIKELNDEGEIVTKKEGTKEYYKIVSLLKDFLPVYEGLHDDSMKRLYFPTVVFVKDGEILGIHEGTVDSQKDPYINLTEEEEKELSKIYKGYMHQVLDDVCDESC